MAVDTNYNSVALLLKCDGTDTSTTFTDNSPVPKTVTANGNAQISTAQSKFGGASALFDGTGDYLGIPDSTDLTMGSSDFTIEGWVRFSVVAAVQCIYVKRATETARGIAIFMDVDSKLYFNAGDSNTAGWEVSISSSALSTNTWYHFALTRSGSSWRAFIDGTQIGSTVTASFTVDDGSTGLRLGLFASGTGGLNGYLDDIRVTKGVARYTTTFTPPTISHPITDTDSNYDSVVLHLPCNGINTSTAFPDTKGHTVTASGNAQVSTAQSKWGGASALFDGTGDSLNSGFVAMDASDFTLEGWFYFNALGAGNRTLFSQYTGADAARTILDIRNAKLSIFSGANGTQSGATTLSTGQWYHIAFVRQGSTCKGYLNGVLEVTHSTFQTPYSTNMLIASYPGASGDEYSGYIDDLRLTRGVARYTANFTAPTGPFPTTGIDANFANVVLLLHGEGTNLSTYVEDQAPSTKTLTCSGNAKISDSNAKWGSSCLSFDGTGDYLSMSTSSDLGFGTGDFTIELWVYPNVAGSTDVLFDFRTGSGSQVAPGIFRNAGLVGLFVNGAYVITAGSTMSATTWHHVAICRASGTTKLFIDGTQSGSSYTDSNNYGSTLPLRVGADTSGANGFAGYIDDIRITKGVARYTANFTAPVGAFPDSGPTAIYVMKRSQNNMEIYQPVPIFHLYL